MLQQAVNLGLEKANDNMKEMHLRLTNSYVDKGTQLMGIQERFKKIVSKAQQLDPSICDALLID